MAAHKARQLEIPAALNNSFGFGGHNAALVFTSLTTTDPEASPVTTTPAAADSVHCGQPRSRRPPARAVRRRHAAAAQPAATTPGRWRARGEIDGTPAIAFATDGTRMGGALGTEGCRTIVDAIDAAVRERVPVVGLWHSGGARLHEGVVALDGDRPGVRRDGARLRPGTADLGGARAGGRRRGLRPGADRHRDHERHRPDLRDRPRGGPQRHRRAGRHGAAGRPGAARPALRRGARDHQGRRVGAGRGARGWPRCSAGRGGCPRPTSRRTAPTWPR